MNKALLLGMLILTAATILIPGASADPVSLVEDAQAHLGTCVGIMPGQIPPFFVDPQSCFPPQG